VDLTTSDVEASKAFYGEVLGWQFEDTAPEYGGYVNATSDGHLVAAITPRMEGSQGPDVWTTYISTDNADATAAAVTEAGGTILMPVMAVGEVGTFAMARLRGRCSVSGSRVATSASPSTTSPAR
jgi:predicted enzyme related to lactoylglutathione lyase